MDLDILAEVIDTTYLSLSTDIVDVVLDCVESLWEDPELVKNPFNARSYNEVIKMNKNKEYDTFSYLAACQTCKTISMNRLFKESRCIVEHENSVNIVCIDKKYSDISRLYGLSINYIGIRYFKYICTLKLADNLIVHWFRGLIHNNNIFIEQSFDVDKSVSTIISCVIFARVMSIEDPMSIKVHESQIQKIKNHDFYRKLLTIPAFYDKICSELERDKNLLRRYQFLVFESNYIDDNVKSLNLLFEQRGENDCTDVVFICKDGIERAHRCVLQLQPYFKAMFNSGMSESKSNSITLPYTQNVVKNSLKMVYNREWNKEDITDLDSFFELVDMWLTE